MTTNPWKFGPADREAFRECLDVRAEKLRRVRDSPGFVRPAPYCVEDLIIMCQEAGEVEVGMIFLLIAALLGEGEAARDATLSALVDVVEEVMDEEIRFDIRSN